MTDFDFDFGFTAVDENELQSVQAAATAAESFQEEAKTTQDRLDAMYNAIMPLLNNLKANPEKEYILWPNRTERIEAFEEKLLDIYQGK